MILIIGPLYSGKRAFARELLKCSEEELERRAVWDVQDLAADASDLSALADTLAEKEVVITTEIGGGVVPMEKDQRMAREAAGRLTCLLAKKADTVVRVFCGLPMVLKGNL